MVEDGAQRLPDGLEWKTVGDIVAFEYGKGLTKSKRDENGKVPVYGSNGIVGYHSSALIHKPCLIIGRKGAAGAVHKSMIPCWAIDTTYYAIPPESANLNFLYYLFSSLDFPSLDRSTAIPGLNRNDAYAVKIPFPPLPEQERIVNRIEGLFSDLEAGVAALERVRVGLKRYKASVLKAACEGKLLESRGVESSGELPEGWRWATVEDACERIVDCLHSTPKFQDNGFYCVDSNWIKPGRFVFEKARFVDEPTFIERNRRMVPQFDDVVFSREGALLGIAVHIPENFEFCLGQRMMIFRPSKNLSGKYLEVVLNSEMFKKQYAKQITGTASPHLNIGDIRQFLIPLPPLDEQWRIVAEVERRLSVVGEVESAVDVGLVRAGRLRQAVLRSAFEGRL